jgi:hypothetical protein
VFLATSRDGLSWTTHPSPVLAAGAARVFKDVVYRSTFEYDADTDDITFWYSGARYDNAWIWGSAVQRRTRQSVFDQIARPSAAMMTMMKSRAGVPALLNAP